jgi:hypothetical protein
MSANIRRDLEKRAQDAILKSIVEDYKQQQADWYKDPRISKIVREQALYHPGTALLLAATLVITAVLAIFNFWLAAIPAALLGILALAVFLYLGLTDEKKHAKVVQEMLRPKVNFQPESIQNNELRAKVNEALKYWELIDTTVASSPQNSIRDRFERTTRETTLWLQAVYNLAERIDRYERNQVVKQDLQRVPQDIRALKKRLAEEDSPEVQRQLERTINDKERQLQTLQSLEDNMQKAH